MKKVKLFNVTFIVVSALMCLVSGLFLSLNKPVKLSNETNSASGNTVVTVDLSSGLDSSVVSAGVLAGTLRINLPLGSDWAYENSSSIQASRVYTTATAKYGSFPSVYREGYKVAKWEAVYKKTTYIDDGTGSDGGITLPGTGGGSLIDPSFPGIGGGTLKPGIGGGGGITLPVQPPGGGIITHGNVKEVLDNNVKGASKPMKLIPITSTVAETITTTDMITTTDNHTIRPVWTPINYKLKLSVEPGKITSSGSSSVSYSTDYAYDKSYTIPLTANGITAPDGYTFKGWATKEYSSTVVYGDGANFINLKSEENATATLYAVWGCTVTLDGNGGAINGSTNWTGSGTKVTKNLGLNAKLDTLPTANDITKSGYHLAGWVDANNNPVNAETVITSKAHCTLKAVWNANEYTIEFNSNDGTNATKTQTHAYNTSRNLTANSFTRLGWDFIGWNTDSEGKGTSYLDKELVKNLTTTNGVIIKLYAMWEKTWASVAKTVTPTKVSGVTTYKVGTAEELAWISLQVRNGNNNFSAAQIIQVATIDLDGLKWQAIGTSDKPFLGKYNGNGFLIKNINTTSEKDGSGKYAYSNAGLFGYANGAILENINIISGNVYGNENVGSIVAYANGGAVRNCRNGATVSGNTNCGMIGYANNTQIISCYNYGNVTGDGNVGGLLGKGEGCVTIENCYANCSVKVTNNGGGIVGYMTKTTGEAYIKASGFNGELTCTAGVGLIVGKTDKSVKVENNFAISSKDNTFAEGCEIVNCVSSAKGTRHLYGNDFSNWTTVNGNLLPAGFSWIGLVGKN